MSSSWFPCVVLPRWLQKRLGVMFVDDIWARWSCDQCEAMGIRRDVALIFGRHWKHELTHTDEEWAAAGYDKAGTLAFYEKGLDGVTDKRKEAQNEEQPRG